MRFHLEFLPNQGIYNLHNDILQFFNNCRQLTRFRQASLFTPALQNVVNDSRDLLDKFKAVFYALNRPGIDKQFVYDTLTHNNNVRELLINTGYPLHAFPTPLYNPLLATISSLYSFLWSSTIKTQTCVTNYGCLEEHYVLLDRINHSRTRRICPFCGLEKLKNPKEKRNEYDHYLDKDRYPYIAINFLNLVPMCDTCNKRPNKGTQNIIVNQDTGTRRIAYYPYEGVEAFTITLNCQNLFSLNEVWSVDTVCASDYEGFRTWKVVFKINARYSNYLKDEYEFWLRNFSAYFNNTAPADLAGLRARIHTFYEYRIGCAMEPGDFLEISFWNFLENIGDSDLQLFWSFLLQRNLILNN